MNRKSAVCALFLFYRGTPMKNNPFKTAFVKLMQGFVLVLTAYSAQAETPAPAHLASPDQYQLLTENAQVLVLKMVLKPGESDALHSHRNETVYFERGGTLEITQSDGSKLDVEVPNGHVMWHAAWAHQVKNAGKTEVVAIIVEQK